MLALKAEQRGQFHVKDREEQRKALSEKNYWFLHEWQAQTPVGEEARPLVT